MGEKMRHTLTMEEKFALITECRQSGQSDNQWLNEHGISGTTFYRWIRQIRANANAAIPTSVTEPGRIEKQDVVRVEMVPSLPATSEKRTEGAAVHATPIEPTLEIEMAGAHIKVTNAADPRLLAETIRQLRGALC